LNAIRIGEEAGLPVHVSHFKASGKLNWGSLRLAIDQIEKARARGLKVTADQYPYIASSTSLEATLLPAWSREGSRSALQDRRKDPQLTQRIRDDVLKELESASRIRLVSCGFNRRWIGSSIDEVAKSENRETVDIVLDIERNGGASVINFGMHEDDLQLAMPLSWVATASDGGGEDSNMQPAASSIVRHISEKDWPLCH